MNQKLGSVEAENEPIGTVCFIPTLSSSNSVCFAEFQEATDLNFSWQLRGNLRLSAAVFSLFNEPHNMKFIFYKDYTSGDGRIVLEPHLLGALQFLDLIDGIICQYSPLKAHHISLDGRPTSMAFQPDWRCGPR